MPTVQFEHFYSYDEMKDFLKEAVEMFPKYIQIEALAKTDENRALFLAKLTDFSTPQPEKRSAYFVQAGLHANEGAGTTAALHLIERLLNTPEGNALLSEVIFYIVPRVNPDGTEYSIKKSAPIRSGLEKREDIVPNSLVPSDINNDGMILQMRVKNALGNKADYNSTGIMLERTSNDSGPFYDVYTEGKIENYDGGAIRSAMRSLDFNRSYPMNWLPFENAEDYPCRGTETRAVMEFMVTHPNIFAMIDYHCGSCGILRPLMSSDSELCQEDRNTILDVGRLASKISGLPLVHEREYKDPDADPDIPYGCTNEWAYHALGISSYVIELGNGFNGIGLETSEILRNWRNVENSEWLERIVARHRAFGSEILVPWQRFDHPQLGEVEIGGFKDGMAYYMYPPDMESVIPKTTDFLLLHAQMRPKLVLDNLEKVRLGCNLWRIRADCMNIGRFGTTVMVGAKGHLAKKETYISIEGEGVEGISRPERYCFCNFASMQKEKLEWFVQAAPGARAAITITHPKSTPFRLSFDL